jgi:HAD superfamily hydrolase (TIGR01549 family)
MNQAKLKAAGIFLDLDGTLVDSTQAYIEAARVAYRELKQDMPELKVVLEIPRRLEQGLTVNSLIEGDAKKFLHIYLDAYYSLTEAKTKLLPNTTSALEALSQKSKLGLITMRHFPNQVVQKELDFFGIAKYFSHVVTALDTSKPKPSPEALIKCARALDVEIYDCIMAGDSVNDVRAGKAAGARTVAVLSGLFAKHELALEKPDLIISDISALSEFIK